MKSRKKGERVQGGRDLLEKWVGESKGKSHREVHKASEREGKSWKGTSSPSPKCDGCCIEMHHLIEEKPISRNLFLSSVLVI